MVGAFVIILDPIFQGLAVSLLFGVGVSTLLTLVVIPVLYYHLIGKRSALATIHSASFLGETNASPSEPASTSPSL
jgi:Cu/Ag efflux pump CusA